ncbi:hypothetical protein HDV06_000293 [Boothiomyces sp. JEL0866]|nr:hypothetical protein HDV06_000293 [Boothiomyces sp. JEL0866]
MLSDKDNEPQLVNKNLLKKPKSVFKSPTDNMFSPMTQKIEAKRNHLMKSVKPTSLNSRFMEAQREAEAEKSVQE